MLKVVLFACAVLVVLVSAAPFDEIVAMVNSKPNSTWTAVAPDNRFGSLEDVKKVCGTWLKTHPNHVNLNLPVFEESPEFVAVEERADGLDLRTQFPNCTVIAKIRDQSACGSCWAFGSTECYQERLCISNGKDVELSTDDTAGCATSAGMGCDGGQPDAALEWMARDGVVTGGDFFDIGAGTSCKPYEFAACAHHVPPSAKYPACPTAEYSIRCHKTCSEAKYTTAYADDKVKGGKVSSVSSVKGMVTALEKGPISVAITVYADFPTYKSGIYKHTSGAELGGHAVEIIGYGTDNGEDYWIVKNSWNEQWGDGGTIKMAKGIDECGIESDATIVDF